MEALLAKIAGMSVTASYLAVAVALLHLLLKKAPKSLLCGLWALVGIRLVCPFSVESVFSLIPRQTAVSREILYISAPSERAILPSPGITQGTAPVMGGGTAVSAGHPVISWGTVIAIVWLLGVAAMLIYGLVSCLRIRKKVSPALPMEGNVFLCDYIASPFIFGIRNPRIYLPSDLEGETCRYVLAHERAHLSRRDHWWKLLGFLLLAVHWFNPVLWLSYCLLCRDIEMACDEKVIRDLGTGARKRYSLALLNCSVPGHILIASPLAFGEVGVKERVKHVLNYKKPAIYVIALCILVSILAAGCLMTDPKTEALEPIRTGSSTEPAVDPQDSREKTVGPFSVNLSTVQLYVPTGWWGVGSNVNVSGLDVSTYKPQENPYMELAPDGVEDCRVRVEIMADQNYKDIFLKELPKNLTASECAVRYYPAVSYSPAGSRQWQYLVIPAKSTYCVIENRFSAEEWETYGSGTDEILGNIRVPECELTHDEAVACAKEHFTDHHGYDAVALPDYEKGCWNVTFRKSGQPNEVVCLGLCGEFREHHQEPCYTEDHHETENHHEEDHHSNHHR